MKRKVKYVNSSGMGHHRERFGGGWTSLGGGS